MVETGAQDVGLDDFIKSIKDKDLKEVEQDLAVEYAGLFLNMRLVSVAPFESVYTSPEHLLMQEARDEVLSEYRREGLDKVKDFKEPEDHIALELGFMAYLCQRR